VSGALSALAVLHAALARALILYALVLAAWSTYQFIRYRAVSGGFRASFLLMFGLTLLQGLFGALSFATGQHPRELLHVVYGIFAAVFLPGVYTYVASGAKDREAAFLAVACWVVLVAYGRGLTTG
jgi:CDP-diglyceride synthetase